MAITRTSNTSTIIDLDLQGRENNNGTAREFYDDDALDNALTLWLTSKKGDYVLDPSQGGVLDALQFKNLAEGGLELLKFSIENSINNNFDTLISLKGIELVLQRDIRVIEIYISYQSLLTRQYNKSVIYLDDPRDAVPFTFQDIDLVEENLYNFAIIKEPSMEGAKLLYNMDEGSWIWGKFKLIDFTNADPYFTQILALINT